LKGTLTVADARQHQLCFRLSQSCKNQCAEREIVRNYWNESVSAYILKQGKILTLVEIDKAFMQKTA
jgi:hypothetical protein